MDIEICDKVANKLYNKIPKVNKLLTNCELDSKLVKKGAEEKLEKIFSKNASDIVVKRRSRRRLNLLKVSEMVKKLSMHAKSSSDMSKKKTRTGSISSVASDDNNRDYQSEAQIHLREMRKIIERIQNTSINFDDGNSAFEAVTTSNNIFLQLVFGIQRITNEMKVIASNDCIPTNSLSLSFVDDSFIDQLNHLDKCLCDMQKLNENKNPVTSLERKENLKLEHTAIINNILATIDKNTH